MGKPTLPNKIFLQWYGENGEEPDEIDENITWCEDSINHKDVPYFRKGKSKEIVAQAKREVLEGLIKFNDKLVYNKNGSAYVGSTKMRFKKVMDEITRQLKDLKEPNNGN